MQRIHLTQRPNWLALLAAFVAMSLVLLGRPHHSGIEGQVFLHNRFVVNGNSGQVGTTVPFHATFQVYSAKKARIITTVTADSDGMFRVFLPPGQYHLVPETMWRGRALKPDEIVIGPYEVSGSLDVIARQHELTPVSILYEQMMGF